MMRTAGGRKRLLPKSSCSGGIEREAHVGYAARAGTRSSIAHLSPCSTLSGLGWRRRSPSLAPSDRERRCAVVGEVLPLCSLRWRSMSAAKHRGTSSTQFVAGFLALAFGLHAVFRATRGQGSCVMKCEIAFDVRMIQGDGSLRISASIARSRQATICARCRGASSKHTPTRGKEQLLVGCRDRGSLSRRSSGVSRSRAQGRTPSCFSEGKGRVIVSASRIVASIADLFSVKDTYGNG